MIADPVKIALFSVIDSARSVVQRIVVNSSTMGSFGEQEIPPNTINVIKESDLKSLLVIVDAIQNKSVELYVYLG